MSASLPMPARKRPLRLYRLRTLLTPRRPAMGGHARSDKAGAARAAPVRIAMETTYVRGLPFGSSKLAPLACVTLGALLALPAIGAADKIFFLDGGKGKE